MHNMKIVAFSPIIPFIFVKMIRLVKTNVFSKLNCDMRCPMMMGSMEAGVTDHKLSLSWCMAKLGNIHSRIY